MKSLHTPNCSAETGNATDFNRHQRGRIPGGWVSLCAASVFVLLMAISVSPLRAGEVPSAGSATLVFRIGFSSNMVTNVNQNDVEAAMKVWIQELTSEYGGTPIETRPRAFDGLQAIAHAVRTKLVDAIALTTPEYWRLRGELQSRIIVTAAYDGSAKQRYVLLVRRRGPIERMRDLRGHSVTLWQDPRMSLASTWLDVLLHKDGLGCVAKFCRVKRDTKLSQVVLPVFFHRIDACVVTRQGFETMSELNPQLGRQLRVLASSPALVPGGLFFRGDYTGPMKKRILHETSRVHTSPAGQQILTLFQCDNLSVQPVSCLEPAFKLLETESRLRASGSTFHAKAMGPNPHLAKRGRKEH